MTENAANLVSSTIASFIVAPSSVHEQLSLVDFFARLSFALAVPGALTSPEFQLALPCSPGLGALKEGLVSIERQVERPFLGIAKSALTLLSTRLPTPDPSLQSIEMLRNHLFHGGGQPPGIAAVTGTVVGALQGAIEILCKELSNSLIEARPVGEGPLLAVLHHNGVEYNLNPFLAFSPMSNAVLVFCRVTSSAIVLNAAQHEKRYLFPRSDYEIAVRRIFRANSADSLASDFTQAALEDLEGFQEPGTSVGYCHESDGVSIHWVHADGSQAAPRQDRLRVGPDNAWQWQSEGSWKGYSELLRRLSNWSTLTHRLASILSDRISETRAQENSFVPIPSDITAPFIPPTVRVGPIGSEKAQASLEEFANRLDEDVEANRGTTRLYFVHAEAGAGKTTALMRLAHDRASLCAKVNVRLPLLLYISARGNVLENLDKAVDATVAETRVLTSASVRALCRNGLVIPIVDGFDELVGSPTYSDALASLRPWLKALGGRGVMVVSARSNYFVSLYEDSIRRETNRDISVRHFIAELDRWTPEQRDTYLEHCRITRGQLHRLRSSELEMLRLPFFARASVGLLLAHESTDMGLLVALMRGYIEREQAKLEGPNNDRLVSLDDLDNIFEELAAWMMEQGTREVAWPDFLVIAGVSIGRDFSGEIQNRLIALCGLDVRGGHDRRFRFSHEIFLDFFFGRRVGRQFSARNVGELFRILSRVQLTSGSTRVALEVSRIKLENFADILLACEGRGAGVANSLLAANAGLVWSELLSAAGQAKQLTVVAAEFGALDLRSVDLESVIFERCSFGTLRLGGMRTRAVRFSSSSIQELHFDGSGAGFAFYDCFVDVAFSAQMYGEEPDEVHQVIAGTGAIISEPSRLDKEEASNLAESARLFLKRIYTRALSIVVASDRLPEDDPSLGWVKRNSEQWLEFLRALENYGLASLQPLNAGGAPKFRVRLVVSPQVILEFDDSVPEVREFWRAIGAPETWGRKARSSNIQVDAARLTDLFRLHRSSQSSLRKD